jgi:hypothetical protein
MRNELAQDGGGRGVTVAGEEGAGGGHELHLSHCRASPAFFTCSQSAEGISRRSVGLGFGLLSRSELDAVKSVPFRAGRCTGRGGPRPAAGRCCGREATRSHVSVTEHPPLEPLQLDPPRAACARTEPLPSLSTSAFAASSRRGAGAERRRETMSRWRAAASRISSVAAAAAAESRIFPWASSSARSLPPPPRTLFRSFAKSAAATATSSSPSASSSAVAAAGPRPEVSPLAIFVTS